MGIPAELKNQFLQNIAQVLFEQTKQMVLSTLGQENTPELQISKDQQMMMIAQCADQALLYYVDQYEKQFGPITKPPKGPDPLPLTAMPMADPMGDAPPDAPPDAGQMIPSQQVNPMADDFVDPAEAFGDSEELHPSMPLAAPMAEALPPAPPVPKGPHPHDKYAAVSLLLSTLGTEHQRRVLAGFNPEEQELIQFYHTPENIQQNLDISCVTRHLQDFKAMVKQGAVSLKNKTAEAFEALTAEVGHPQLVQWVSSERPLVRQYIAACQPATDEDEPVPAPRRKKGLPFGEILPPRVEEALYDYLSQKAARRPMAS
jgi:hypothetical protein